MQKSILIPFIVFGFIILPDNIFRQEIYKSVDEIGTINFSDRPASSAEGAARQDGNELANLPGQEIYKSIDEKGTVNFSDNPTSSVVTTRKGSAKQDGVEVLKRNEMANGRGQEIYKSVDEKGTVTFSDGPRSPVTTTKRMSARQEREEILKRNETANRPMTDAEIKAVLLTMPTWRGSASTPGWGSSGSVRKGRS